MNHKPASAVTAALALAIAGCGATSAQHPNSTRSPTNAARPHRHRAAQRRSPTSRPRSRAGLAYSTASSSVVQPQPAAGTCHAIGSGLHSRPDPSCTRGALNPAVTQATIDKTICVSGWTEAVRPPESVTEHEKAASMAAYGDSGSMDGYEYDHFVPLELGGATNDPRNLWPEPGASPNPKDAVEDSLRQAVCEGRISLARAQREVVTNWTLEARRAHAHANPGTGECTVSASYNARYRDYDVYVHSNQPDRAVTVTDTDGHSDTWHTDGAGYADVYFHAAGMASGRQITARVGTATCSTTL